MPDGLDIVPPDGGIVQVQHAPRRVVGETQPALLIDDQHPFDHAGEDRFHLGAIAVELGVGLCLMAGLLTRWAALILAAYTLALGLIFHAYWLAPAADLRFERIIFFNHLSIIGRMLAFVAFGAGCFSLDAAMGRKSA